MTVAGARRQLSIDGPAMARLEELIGGLSDDDWQRDSSQPWGTPVKVGQGLIDMPLKVLSTYRMQLFCQAKASGASDLDSANCWIGIDRPKENEAAS